MSTIWTSNRSITHIFHILLLSIKLTSKIQFIACMQSTGEDKDVHSNSMRTTAGTDTLTVYEAKGLSDLILGWAKHQEWLLKQLKPSAATDWEGQSSDSQPEFLRRWEKTHVNSPKTQRHPPKWALIEINSSEMSEQRPFGFDHKTLDRDSFIGFWLSEFRDETFLFVQLHESSTSTDKFEMAKQNSETTSNMEAALGGQHKLTRFERIILNVLVLANQEALMLKGQIEAVLKQQAGIGPAERGKKKIRKSVKQIVKFRLTLALVTYASALVRQLLIFRSIVQAQINAAMPAHAMRLIAYNRSFWSLNAIASECVRKSQSILTQCLNNGQSNAHEKKRIFNVFSDKAAGEFYGKWEPFVEIDFDEHLPKYRPELPVSVWSNPERISAKERLNRALMETLAIKQVSAMTIDKQCASTLIFALLHCIPTTSSPTLTTPREKGKGKQQLLQTDNAAESHRFTGAAGSGRFMSPSTRNHLWNCVQDVHTSMRYTQDGENIPKCGSDIIDLVMSYGIALVAERDAIEIVELDLDNVKLSHANMERQNSSAATFGKKDAEIFYSLFAYEFGVFLLDHGMLTKTAHDSNELRHQFLHVASKIVEYNSMREHNVFGTPVAVDLVRDQMREIIAADCQPKKQILSGAEKPRTAAGKTQQPFHKTNPALSDQKIKGKKPKDHNHTDETKIIVCTGEWLYNPLGLELEAKMPSFKATKGVWKKFDKLWHKWSTGYGTLDRHETGKNEKL